MIYICAIIKDEHDCIREWALHNRALGFDKIVLYDNNSSMPYDGIFDDLMRDGFIELRPWTDTRWSRQVRAYNDFVRGNRWSNDDWCAFIDPDEFIFFDNVKTISEFVNMYSDFAGVGLSWKTYNAGGHITPPDLPTVEAYTSEFNYWEPRVKPVGRLNRIANVTSSHAFTPTSGYLVTTGGKPIFGMNPAYNDHTNGHIKHYITKSWQDWVKRLKRGNITKGLRTVDTFFTFNPDMAHLKDELTKDLNFDEFPTIKQDSGVWDGATAESIRVLLQVDFLTDKIYGVKEYTGDGGGIDATVDRLDFLEQADKEGHDCFYENGKIVKKTKAPDEFYNKIAEIKKDIERLKSEERNAFVEYAQNRLSGSTMERLRAAMLAREEKRRELSAMKEERAKFIKRHIENKLNETQFKYYCSICMIIKDDNEYLEEWLTWHIGQGVEYFYIYDHDSKPSVSEFMKTLAPDIHEKVTVIDWSGSHDFAQHDAYNDCLKKYGGESRWIGYIDSDEMVRVIDGTPIPEFLKEFEPYAGVFAEWEVYGANGQKDKSPHPVRERFKKSESMNCFRGMGKVFVQPLCMRQMITHNGYPVDGFSIVDESHNVIAEGVSWLPNTTKNRICVDHYYTKSYEEWLEKISRGSCDPYFSRKYDDFFKYNPDMEYCRENVYPIQIYEASKTQGKKEPN